LQATLDTHLRRAELKSPVTLLFSDVDQLTGEAQSRVMGCLASSARRRWLLSTARGSLTDLVQRGTFLGELACLMSTLEISLPTLSERISDVPLIAQMFLEECNRAGGKQVGGFSSAALDMLCGYPWPGNLDELSEVVRCAHRSAANHQIEVDNLPDPIHFDAQAAEFPRRVEESLVLEDFLGQIEKGLIRWTLDHCKGNKSKAAEKLGMSRPRFYRRLEQLRLDDGPGGESDG
jgi:DNA-binding NtrC family response regulator